MKIAEIISSLDKSVISEETASAIASAFDSAVNEKVTAQANLLVEKALKEQDEDHAAKLKQLIEQIDKDHTGKLKDVVKAINENHTQKLLKLVSYYRKAINEKAEKFSDRIVEEMSNYLDLYLDKIVPREQLAEAVANVQAKTQLIQIRKIVGLDGNTLSNPVKNAIVEGKQALDSLRNEVRTLTLEKKSLAAEAQKAKASLLIEQKTKGMPSSKKEFVGKILSDKSPEYILENFNYVVEMFEKDEVAATTSLASTARQTAVTKDAKVVKSQVLSESTQKVVNNPYLQVLQSIR
jgi:hypothetical protein